MKKKWLLYLLAVAILYLAAFTALSAEFSASTVLVTNYELSAPISEKLRIVQLTDLHNAEFGEENKDLVKQVKDLKPDMIFVTGDMLNSGEYRTGIFIDLLKQLVKIAPVYVCYGNHEASWQRRFEKELRTVIEETGASLLEAEYVDVEVKGVALRLGGYAGYYRAPTMTTADPEQQKQEIQFAKDFEDTGRYKILLNHIPTVWLDWDYREEYNVDLVFCGHYHGGQIRLPWIGGLYAPNIGWFPQYTMGLYNDGGAAVVLSAGLGSNRRVPRINNPGEIVCLDLIPEK